MADSPVDAAGKLVPLIRSCADQIDAARELPRSLFEALADAGMFHLAFPRSLGGAELDLPTYVEVIEEIGKADASTGWIVNQNSIFATYAARMPRDVARAIWVETPRAVVANTPAPTAKAIVVPGGYRVTGRQGFSTGCRHAAWVAAHAQIIENGQVRLEGEAPEARYMFVPVAEAELLDTWHTRGMRGQREQRTHARASRKSAAGDDARDSSGGADHRQRVQRRGRDGRLRGPPAPAALPGHPRDHTAPAGTPRSLRADRPLLARP